ncbi:MAG TPA: sigma-54 dependent transcriptional regulator [Bacteroidales bacterium]|jgi:DNA-binding NtrC family response regulator|nr:sigma-54-dependent Fis family transcriptional regulator [Bacteroidales bacterium]HOX77423.1 sigma-54 dependent transcriptional regulator [Bacteroidales bacterium]HPI87217.1 sigma-54 dependent transcriptional regulator [Bacteroidales bacterium]HPM92592.1 sigma-54 dependent transcriptional regulator [Bacteroidales bacterium]
MSKILVVDDERSIRNTLRDILTYEKYDVSDAESGIVALEMLRQSEFDVILLDIKMPQMDGMEVLDHILAEYEVPVIMISGHGTIETAVDAIKKGAYDYVAKPLDLNRLLITIRNALDKSRLMTETRSLKKRVSKKYEIIGETEVMNGIREMIDRVAPTHARVLITGDNGTGKELVARQLHEKSLRARGPFIEVNCAAIPSELIESNLFGHEKGSFTSAIKQRKGDFELATGGTIFLDEIGDMSLTAQAKVLRALQENKIMRVGGEKEIPVDVRVIAATNKNLKDEIAAGRFREDLYHRLSVILIHVPPLRERVDDIPVLAHYFMEEICAEQGKPLMFFTDEAFEELKMMKWTGNIRELRNVVERLIILCDKEITDSDVRRFAQPLVI